MNDYSSSKSTFSWEDREIKEKLNDAILLSSNDEILSKSDDDIFYDTNEFSFSWENNLTTNMSNISEKEEYKSCSDLLESTDSTSRLSLPCPKSYFKNVTSDHMLSSSQNSNLQNQENLRLRETNNDVPLRVVLKRMFDEILGKHTEETSSACSVNECSTEINNNDSLHKLLNNDDPCPSSESVKDTDEGNTLPPCNKTISISNEWYPRNLETILEHCNENSGVSSQQSTLNWSAKCISKLTNCSFRKLSKHWIHDKIRITNDISDSICSDSNNSTDIETISKEIFMKLNGLKDDSLKSIDHDVNLPCANEKLIITNSINREEYKFLKLKNHKIPFIIITPATPI